MHLISIITINYNNAVGLNKTIKSVINQTYKNIEYIVIDGGSNDESAQLIKENEASISFWLSEKDKGVFDAQNKGIAKANGDYVLVLNSGDELENPNVLQTIFDNKIYTEELIYGNMIVVKTNGIKRYAKMPNKITFEHMMVDTLWHPVSFVKKEFLNKVGAYNVTYSIVADYDWFLRALFNFNPKLKYIDMPISVFYLGGLSSLLSNAQKLKAERLNAQINVFGKQKVDDYLKLQNRKNKTSIIKRLIKKIFW